MSLIWRMYYIDWEIFSEFCCHGNSAIAEETTEKYFTSALVPYEGVSVDDLTEAIRGIAAGDLSPSSPEGKFMIPLALEAVCNHLGTLVNLESFKRCRWEWIDEMEILEPLIESGPPVPLGSNLGETVIGYLTPEQVKTVIGENERYDTDDVLSPINDESPDILSDRCTFISWLKEAKPNEAVVSFLY